MCSKIMHTVCYNRVELKSCGLAGGSWSAMSSPKLNEAPCSLCDADSDELSSSTNEEFFAMDDGADGTSCAQKRLPLITLLRWTCQIPSVLLLK